MTETITNKYTKTFSHVTSISLKAVNIDTFTLEFVSEITEKEFTETIRRNAPKNSPHKQTSEKILKVWEKVDTYSLHQINVQEIMKIRLSKVPGVIYKKDNLFFYSAISGELSLAGKSLGLGKHACGEQCTMVCNGCPRTKALTVAFQERIGKSFPVAVSNSWRIEKYDFVLEGLEAFNMFGQNDSFIVLKCKNYQASTNKHRRSYESLGNLKAKLACYVWDDFGGSRAEMLFRLKSSGLKGTNF